MSIALKKDLFGYVIIKSISFDQEEIIDNILRLHCGCDIDLDPTYSTGNFYKSGRIKQPRFRFDLMPQVKGVGKADSRNLPISTESLKVIMFDPPFVANGHNKDCVIINRFGQYDTPEKLLTFYNKSIVEFNRVLKNNGILIFKCQDFIISGKQNFTHVSIMEMAVNNNFYHLDLFILLAKNRIMRHKKQLHARKFHSYFWVFKKNGRGHV